MKSTLTLLYFSFLLLGAKAQSGSTDQQNLNYAKKIIGTWEVTKTVEVNDGEKDIDTEPHSSITFYSTGKFKTIERLENNKQEATNGSFEIKGDKIIMDKGTKNEQEALISKLTKTELVIYMKDDEDPKDVSEFWIYAKKKSQ